MSVMVILYSVYVPEVGVKLFTGPIDARKYKDQRQRESMQPVWGVGKHTIEVVNCVEVPEASEAKAGEKRDG